MAKKYTPAQIDAFFKSGGDMRALTSTPAETPKAPMEKQNLPRGKAHTWIVPPDIEKVFQKRGTAWLWDAVRFKVKYDEQHKK